MYLSLVNAIWLFKCVLKLFNVCDVV